MNVPLPLPNPHEWYSTSGAADALGITLTTLKRMVADRRLTRYRTKDGRGTVYWCAEVDELAQARLVAKGGVDARR